MEDIDEQADSDQIERAMQRNLKVRSEKTNVKKQKAVES
jgi:hypothetical protein